MNASWGPKLVDLQTFSDGNGLLTAIEGNTPFPHQIQRIYFLSQVPQGVIRGEHAHKKLHQLIVCPVGTFEITLSDGVSEKSYVMTPSGKGLLIPPGYWRTLQNFTKEAVALVLASDNYTEDDYIRDFDDFLAWKAS